MNSFQNIIIEMSRRKQAWWSPTHFTNQMTPVGEITIGIIVVVCEGWVSVEVCTLKVKITKLHFLVNYITNPRLERTAYWRRLTSRTNSVAQNKSTVKSPFSFTVTVQTVNRASQVGTRVLAAAEIKRFDRSVTDLSRPVWTVSLADRP